MKKLILPLLFLLTFNAKSQDTDTAWVRIEKPLVISCYGLVKKEPVKYKFRLKEHLLPASLIFIAGGLEGVQDHLAFHNRSNHPFWGQNSWLNKYRDKDPSKGKTFRGKYLIFTTDGFHLMKFTKNLFIMGAIATKVSLSTKKRWWVYLVEGCAYWALNRLSFTITYNAF